MMIKIIDGIHQLCKNKETTKLPESDNIHHYATWMKQSPLNFKTQKALIKEAIVYGLAGLLTLIIQGYPATQHMICDQQYYFERNLIKSPQIKCFYKHFKK